MWACTTNTLLTKAADEGNLLWEAKPHAGALNGIEIKVYAV